MQPVQIIKSKVIQINLKTQLLFQPWKLPGMKLFQPTLHVLMLKTLIIKLAWRWKLFLNQFLAYLSHYQPLSKMKQKNFPQSYFQDRYKFSILKEDTSIMRQILSSFPTLSGLSFHLLVKLNTRTTKNSKTSYQLPTKYQKIRKYNYANVVLTWRGLRKKNWKLQFFY